MKFDYVIVGAGSAGCVLASRLTEDPGCNVLLLEAGPRDTDRWIHVPLGYGKLFSRTDINWAYESEPEAALNGIVNSSPMGDYVAAEFMPGDAVRTDDEWLAYCREAGDTVFHPSSTCSIGRVVGNDLKVLGLEGLRVIDASVMPAVPSGNINAAVIAWPRKGPIW